MPYLSVSAVVIHYEEALYQVYAPLPLVLMTGSHKLRVDEESTSEKLLGR